MCDYKSPLEGMYQPHPKPRTGKATALKVAAAFGAVALVGIAGVAVATRCGYALHHQDPVGAPVNLAQRHEQLPAILRRENADESIPDLQPYEYSAPVPSDASGSVASGAAAARATGDDVPEETDFPVGVSVPIMTQTSYNTIYTIRTVDHNTTSTTTLTTTIVLGPSETPTCTDEEPEQTETVVVTITVLPEETQPPAYGTLPDDATVTGSPATVTDVQTDVSYTSGAPDATVSGSPATVTDVQTDTHYTSGAPDATVSGEPATVTSVITDTAGEPMTTLTFTSTKTVSLTVTVTGSTTSSVDFDSSVLGLPHTMTSDYPSGPVVTHTTTVTVTDGAPVTSTTTVELPEPYGDDYPTPYGTGLPINATASSTYIPPVVSAGTQVCGLSSVVYLAIAAMAIACLF